MSYSTEPNVNFDFLFSEDKNTILSKLLGLPYLDAGTATASALIEARTQLLTDDTRGWRENTVPTIALVLTDGKTQDTMELPAAAAAFRLVAETFAIGIGSAVDPVELRTIASGPTTQAAEHVYLLNDAAALLGGPFLAQLSGSLANCEMVTTLAPGETAPPTTMAPGNTTMFIFG